MEFWVCSVGLGLHSDCCWGHKSEENKLIWGEDMDGRISSAVLVHKG